MHPDYCEVCGAAARNVRYQDLYWNPHCLIASYSTVRVLCDRHDQPGISEEDDYQLRAARAHQNLMECLCNMYYTTLRRKAARILGVSVQSSFNTYR